MYKKFISLKIAKYLATIYKVSKILMIREVSVPELLIIER